MKRGKKRIKYKKQIVKITVYTLNSWLDYT